MSKLSDALEEDHYLKVKQAIKDGEDLNQMIEISEDEYSPVLFYALRCRVSVDTIELLIESGADTEYVSEDGVGILDEAVIFGNLDVIKYLVDEKGMDINKTKRKSGMTPFIQACCYGNLEIIDYIYSKGIDIYQKDNSGMDAFDYSKRLGKTSVENYLKKIIQHSE
jgi:ankyrin repeat protein